ncbi:hypothetical protein [Halosimplex sp. J119]
MTDEDTRSFRSGFEELDGQITVVTPVVGIVLFLVVTPHRPRREEVVIVVLATGQAGLPAGEFVDHVVHGVGRPLGCGFEEDLRLLALLQEAGLAVALLVLAVDALLWGVSRLAVAPGRQIWRKSRWGSRSTPTVRRADQSIEPD